ncbi:hypothetical protein [Brevibacterium album]|uniref:hypothetical protein n=1 Tax=Brevibacterium album TaxID=417948 RepID=UPI0003FB9EA7|nr:hypothetical protein [Brevibacterium album]
MEPEADVDDFDVITEIYNAARRARTSNDILSLEDLEQELWVFWLEHGSIQDYTDAKKRSLLSQEARKRLRAERVDYMHFSGAFHYTPDAVRKVLREYSWAEITDIHDVEGKADVDSAFAKLTHAQRENLFRMFALDEADRMSHAEKVSAYRAVDRICDTLNGRLEAEILDTADAWGEA